MTQPFPDRGFAAFLFDMDGTILTSIVAAERVWAAWALGHGLDVEAFLPTIHGVRSVETVRRLALPGVDPGRAKVSAFSEFPGKGRATGGVRSHSFLKGEDMLALAWAGPLPALAVGPDGSVRQLPEAGAKRDASGTPLDAVVGSIGLSL